MTVGPEGRPGSSPVRGRALPPHHPLLALTAAAVVLRLVLLLGRGDYVAFDEGWYLLLGRNLWNGEGFTLSGLRHAALSPLFPILAGGAGSLVGDIVWGGRIVAAVSAGLLVVPCWFVFHRLGGRTTALVACGFVALMPSLAPFVAPYWIGWDLWVGAEPLLHLLLYAGIALFLGAWETGGRAAAALCGVALGLAYLARPEAIVAFGLLGVCAVAASLASARSSAAPASARPRRMRLRSRAASVALCGAAFCVTAAPYWTYLHGTLGRWAITGRGIQVTPSARIGGGESRDRAPNSIEAMLWRDESTYVRRLYALDAEGTALASGYWGVRPAAPRSPAPAAAEQQDRPDGSAGATSPTRSEAPAGGGLLLWGRRYLHALGVVVPWYVWLLVAAGVAGPWLAPPRRDPGAEAEPRPPEPYEPVRPDLEALVGLPLLGTSLLIALLVATDPRTQLFIAPLACFYAARGALVAARGLESKMGSQVRPWFATGVVVGSIALILLATHARRLYLSLAVGSPHHIVAAENAAVGAALDEALPPDATVMSWHPALALFADRDWRVLPLEPMQRIVRYARTQPNPFLVFSVYYPPELLQAEEPHYLVVNLSAETPESERWRIAISEPGEVLAFGRLEPAP